MQSSDLDFELCVCVCVCVCGQKGGLQCARDECATGECVNASERVYERICVWVWGMFVDFRW